MNFNDFFVKYKKIILLIFMIVVIVMFYWISFDVRFRMFSIKDMYNYKIINKNSNKCLDVPSSSSDNGVKILQYNIIGTDNQLWKFLYVNKGLYKIVNKNSNKCLDYKNEAGTEYLVQNQENKSNNQKWILKKDGTGYYYIINYGSGKYLDVPFSSQNPGEKIILYSQTNNENQKWFLQK